MSLLVQRSNKSLCLGLITVLLAGVAWGLAPVRVASGDMVTVCAAGCDFMTVQDALDDSGIIAGDVINITDAVHTESGILVNKDVTIQGQGADSTIVQAHTDVDEATERVFFRRGRRGCNHQENDDSSRQSACGASVRRWHQERRRVDN